MSYGQVNADVIGTSVAGSNLGAGDASLMKNRIINGAMVVNQRAYSGNPANGTYTLDRWFGSAAGAGAGKYSVSQSTTAPAGFYNSALITSLSAYSPSGTDRLAFSQVIEAYNMQDWSWGTANAKTVTLSFWINSSITGTFGGSLQNYAQDYSYPFTYTISSANTWTQISVTIAGPTAGSWRTGNDGGIQVNFALGISSSYLGTAGSWASATYWSATGSQNFVATNGATWYLTGVQLEVGSSATGFEYRQYTTELTLCQRYYEIGIVWGSGYGNNTNGVTYSIPMKVTKRTSPSGTAIDGGASVNVPSYTFTSTDANSCYINFGVSSGFIRCNSSYTISAEL